ncbi:DNA-binding protein [Candidatus Uhrbacteria bacterium]|nr:DNA-binding protein [Candidatus Uhrbacteria bacterium]
MQLILQDGNITVLRFDSGEEVLAGIIKYCKDNTISAGYFSVIGIAKAVLLSYYNVDEKKYEDHDHQKNMEIVHVSGNIAITEQGITPHAHGSFSDSQLNVWAGHVKRLVVSATAEVILTKLSGTIHREFDEATGLRLMKPIS